MTKSTLQGANATQASPVIDLFGGTTFLDKLMQIGHAFIAACLVAVLGVALAMVPSPALGTVIDVALDPNKFGKLDQAKTTCPDTNCGPTAAVNSLVYLQNAFPTHTKYPWYRPAKKSTLPTR
jgi:hypothetical protein